MPQCNPSPLGFSSRTLTIPCAEWFAARARRLSFLVGHLFMLGMLVAAFAMIFSDALSEPPVDTAQSKASKATMQPVEGMAFSPDGKTLASCGWDNSVRLWDVSRLSEGPPFQPVVLSHSSVRYAVAFSADGTLLAAAGEKSLTIWTCESGRYTSLLVEECETSRCLAFSADGRTLALGTDDGSVRLRDMPGGHERAVLKANPGIIRNVAFSADGRRLVSTSESRSIVLWDAIEGVEIGPLEPGFKGNNLVLFAAFSADGRHLAVGEASGTPADVILLDSDTGEVRNRLTGHETGVQALAFSPDGRTLATAGQDRCIKIWDWARSNIDTTLTDGVGVVKSLAFSRDGAWLAFAGDDDTVKIWDVARRKSLLVGRFARSGIQTPMNSSGSNRTAHPLSEPGGGLEGIRNSDTQEFRHPQTLVSRRRWVSQKPNTATARPSSPASSRAAKQLISAAEVQQAKYRGPRKGSATWPNRPKSKGASVMFPPRWAAANSTASPSRRRHRRRHGGQGPRRGRQGRDLPAQRTEDPEMTCQRRLLIGQEGWPFPADPS